VGRPRVYDDPEQIKLRAESSVKAQLRAKAKAAGMTLTAFLMAAAQAFNPGVAPAPEPPQESYAELQRPTSTTELPVLPQGADQAGDVRTSQPMPPIYEKPAEVARGGALPVLAAQQANSTPTTTIQLTPNIWQALAPQLKVRVSEQNFEVWLSSVRLLSFDERRLVLQVPNKFFQEYLTEHYTEVIKEELLSKYNKPYELEFVALPAPPEVEKPAPVVPETPAETDPIIIELLRRDRELAEIDRTTRSIHIANERRELSLQIHRRRMAEASAKLRAFDPDPEKPPTPKEIRAVAAELKPKNRNDHPWRKVLPPKRPK
jgi:hypothetical protein